VSFFRLTEVSRREVILVVASIAAGILLVVAGNAWIGRGADDGKAELERAIADLSAPPAPPGATSQGGGVITCTRDSLDGDSEPEGSADYAWQGGTINTADLDNWYLPAWRDQGWTESGDAPGVLQHHYGGYTVSARLQVWETPPGFSITARIVEPIC
jgi:hypothetical protein